MSQNSNGWLFTGAAAIEASRREVEIANERQQSRFSQRYSLPIDKVTGRGTSGEIIFLEKHYRDMFGLHEYRIPGPGGGFEGSTHVVSCQNFPNMEDPLAGQTVNGEVLKSYFIQVYSILDLRPYKNKDGETVNFSRKLLCVKKSQAGELIELLDKLIKIHGTMRGIHMKMKRGDGKQSPSIGSPQVLDSTMQFGFLTEQELLQRFSHREIRNQDGRVVVAANGFLQPFNYFDVFQRPDPEQQRRRYLSGTVMGSKQEDSETWGQAADEGLRPEEVPASTHTSQQTPPASVAPVPEAVGDSLGTMLAEDLIDFSD